MLVRPSYVLGGRAMEIVYDDTMVRDYMTLYAEQMGGHDRQRPRPILVDKFLEEAIEIDVDLIGDGDRFVVAGVMQHIEEAGVHSGDSACCLPPHSLPPAVVGEIRQQSVALGRELGIRGLMNIQFAVRDGEIYVLEVNPRASRTVPFVSKATGVPLARLATHIMCGARLDDLGLVRDPEPANYAVKEVVLPFGKFAGAEVALGPEMKSTGEVMGIDLSFGRAFAKAQAGAGGSLPQSGTVFMSVRDGDKRDMAELAGTLHELGFHLAATAGTAAALAESGTPGTLPGQGGRSRHLGDRPDGGGPDPVDHQHPERQAPARRREPHPPFRAGARRAMHHHHGRRTRLRDRHRRRAGRRTESLGPPRPVTAPVQERCRVLANRVVAPEHNLLTVATREIGRRAKAGQFAQIRVPGGAVFLPRPFSFLAAEDDRCAFLSRAVGPGTRALAGLAEGAELDLLGPLGHGFDLSAAAGGRGDPGKAAGLACRPWCTPRRNWRRSPAPR